MNLRSNIQFDDGHFINFAVFWHQFEGFGIRNLHLYWTVASHKKQYEMVAPNLCPICNSISLSLFILLIYYFFGWCSLCFFRNNDIYYCHHYWFCYWNWCMGRLKILLSNRKILLGLLARGNWQGYQKHLRWATTCSSHPITVRFLPP